MVQITRPQKQSPENAERIRRVVGVSFGNFLEYSISPGRPTGF
uniref:Uncharacterized protein n=1 Tax=Rhizophora mucronata TaxID=61149 RepID=A0A2P2PGZ5_RHIMU